MNLLNNQLTVHLKNKEIYRTKKIVFSSSNVPGEGEHKIIDCIRKSKNREEINVINGLDADFICLSLLVTPSLASPF